MKHLILLLLVLFTAGIYGDPKDLFEKLELKPGKYLFENNEDVKIAFACPAELLKEKITCKIVFGADVLAEYTPNLADSISWNTRDAKKGEYKIELSSGSGLKKEEYFYVYPAREKKLKEVLGRVENMEITKDLLSKPVVPNAYVRLENLDKFWDEAARTEQGANHFMARACEAEEIAAELERDGDYFFRKTGSFVRAYRSEDDGICQPYHIDVPADYGGVEKYPLIVYLHGSAPGVTKDKWMDWALYYGHKKPGLRTGVLEKFIQVSPYGRGNSSYEGLGEKDVLEVIKDVSKNYSIDENRIYIKGHSMGAKGAVMLGMHYPGLFAGGAYMSGYSGSWRKNKTEEIENQLYETHAPVLWLENGMHLPSMFVHGKADTTINYKESIIMHEKMQALGYDSQIKLYPKVGHMGFPKELGGEIAEFFLKYKKENWPKTLVFTTNTLNYNSSFWFELCGFQKIGQFARVKAVVEGNTIDLELSNVEDFKITVSEALVDMKKEIKVRINGTSVIEKVLPESKVIRFKELNDSWNQVLEAEAPGLIKKKGLCGPFEDAFSNGFIIVYGTAGNEKTVNANRTAALEMQKTVKARYDGDYFVFADAEIGREQIENYNLILFGNPDSNLITAKINDRLPVKMSGGELFFGDKVIKGGNAFARYVYPNPLNPGKYVVLNLNTVPGNMKAPESIRFPDYQITSDETVISGYFGKNWEIDTELQFERVK